MSVSHPGFGPVAVKSRWTRSLPELPGVPRPHSRGLLERAGTGREPDSALGGGASDRNAERPLGAGPVDQSCRRGGRRVEGCPRVVADGVRGSCDPPAGRDGVRPGRRPHGAVGAHVLVRGRRRRRHHQPGSAGARPHLRPGQALRGGPADRQAQDPRVCRRTARQAGGSRRLHHHLALHRRGSPGGGPHQRPHRVDRRTPPRPVARDTRRPRPSGTGRHALPVDEDFFETL